MNGTASTEISFAENIERCASCNSGYALDRDNACVFFGRLHPEFPSGRSIDWDYLISPDGSFVVYRVGDENPPYTTYGKAELYSVPIAGGSVVKLNSTLVAGGSVTSFHISPDSTRVVYSADQDTDGTLELYSVSISGGSVTKLNPTLVAEGDVSSYYYFSPDSTRVVYTADQDIDNVLELYSVPIGGGSVTKLNATLANGGNVETYNYQISPDSMRVVYRADQDTDEVMELYSVPIGGGSVTKLNAALVAGGNVEAPPYCVYCHSFIYRISSDSSRVVYIADQDADDVGELYSVSILGGSVTKLNSTLPYNGNVFHFRISPDSMRVVYRAIQDTSGVLELYSVPTSGGNVTKLNATLVNGGDVDNDDYQISSDSSRVVYLADQDVNNKFELYSAPIAGGSVVKLNHYLDNQYGDVFLGFRISPDSSRVVYRANLNSLLVDEIHSVPITGGSQTKLNPPLALGGDVYINIRITSDSTRVIYLADQRTEGIYELFSVPIAGGTARLLNQEGFYQVPALKFSISSSEKYVIDKDSTRVIYRTNFWRRGNGYRDFELFSAPIL